MSSVMHWYAQFERDTKHACTPDLTLTLTSAFAIVRLKSGRPNQGKNLPGQFDVEVSIRDRVRVRIRRKRQRLDCD